MVIIHWKLVEHHSELDDAWLHELEEIYTEKCHPLCNVFFFLNNLWIS